MDFFRNGLQEFVDFESLDLVVVGFLFLIKTM